MSKKKLGAEEVSVDISSDETILEPNLMETLIDSKLLYGKVVKECIFDGKYYKLTDEDGTTYLKSLAELEQNLK